MMKFRKIRLNILPFSKFLTAILLTLFVLSGPDEPRAKEKPVALATITIISDLLENIAGDRVEVRSLLPLGSDPHTYEPVPGDIKEIFHSDIVFYNGLGLELWLQKILDNAGGSRPHIRVTKGLKSVMGSAGYTDPHLWMNPRFVEDGYIPNILEALIEFDPEGEDYYRENAKRYSAKFNDLDRWARSKLKDIPKRNRKLVTTHDAFQYFGVHYGLEIIGSIWGVSTEDEPSPKQIARLIESIKSHKVQAVFAETTINPKLMQTVARDAGVKIGRPLYGDSLGVEGSGAETYIGMIRMNVMSIVDGLK